LWAYFGNACCAVANADSTTNFGDLLVIATPLLRGQNQPGLASNRQSSTEPDALSIISPGENAISKTADAKSDALAAELPPELAKIVAAWPSLPEPIRRAMLALIA
jgi:hypothetical protein